MHTIAKPAKYKYKNLNYNIQTVYCTKKETKVNKCNWINIGIFKPTNRDRLNLWGYNKKQVR